MNKGDLEAWRKISRAEGMRGIFTGWAPNLFGYSAQGAFKYGGYEFFKKFYLDHAGKDAAYRYKTISRCYLETIVEAIHGQTPNSKSEYRKGVHTGVSSAGDYLPEYSVPLSPIQPMSCPPDTQSKWRKKSPMDVVRGGAGNIESPRVKPTNIGNQKGDTDVVPETALREPGAGYENYHTGRGGAANVHKEKHEESEEKEHEGLVDKIKHKISGKKE
ncbi:MAG: hypothetical protein Q9171_006394 [Xanthocarpia ochracea]